ncbi:MAG: zinc ABC transporter substrate-binding protein [Prolixibacteraceae bacterium]|nr:zinc ABC transporter substrate-binding protein [Prolixibacteraceae bacterium]
MKRASRLKPEPMSMIKTCASSSTMIPLKIVNFNHMKRILFLLILALLFACSSRKNSDNSNSKQVITVSILPQKTFVEKIAGSDFEINLLIPPGASPADYTLIPSQLRSIAKSAVWFRIGYIGFEYSWKDKIEQANQNMKVVDLSEVVSLIGVDKDAANHNTAPAGADPHIWLSPVNVKQIAGKIADELGKLNPEKQDVYNENYLKFIREIDELDLKIRDTLKSYKGRQFIMFHPSLSYFARDYGLVQHSLEPGGKEPTPQRMAEVVEIAKKEDIRVIYIQSDLDINHARVIAEEIDGEIIQMWPLNPEWEKNLLNITQILVDNFR